MILPRKTANYSVFANGGRELLGMADCTAPNIQNLTDTYKGAGIFGEVEVAIQAHFQPMQITLNWHVPCESSISVFRQDGGDLDLWQAVQHIDSSNNRIVHRGWRIQCLTLPAGFDFGTVEVGASSSSVSTFQISRIRASFEEKEMIVIDVDNQICVVEGIDYAARIRQLIGK